MALPRGRPPKSDARLTRAAILAAAAKRLNEADGGTLSLRSLATDLGVTPMSLYAHVDGIDGILDALADSWFSNIPEKTQDDPRDELTMLLAWYCDRVLNHPRLTTALVARHGAIPAAHQAWTDRVVGLVMAAGLSLDWANVLVDHLHGFALSMVAGGVNPDHAIATYRDQIDILIAAMIMSVGQMAPRSP